MIGYLYDAPDMSDGIGHVVIRDLDDTLVVSDQGGLGIVRFEDNLVDIITGGGELYVDYIPHGWCYV